MIFSLISAVDYFWKFWRKVDDKVKRRRRRELLLIERKRNRSAIIRGALSRREQRLGLHDLKTIFVDDQRSDLPGRSNRPDGLAIQPYR